jgi:tRNA-2-methylthio-N6-dimethylallyladenosine synthase
MVDDFVAPDVAGERMRRLVDVVERHALAKHRERVGRVEEVLVEGPSKKDPSVLSGRTRQNKLVHVTCGDSAPEPGTYGAVRIVDAAPHWLRGELVDVVAAPRRSRTRIPVAAGPG